MNSTTRARANRDLKSVLSSFRSSYKMACESSRVEYIKTLSPGARLPEAGKIYGNDAREEFKSLCRGYQQRVCEISEKYVDELKEEATTAPSTDAVNSITLLSLRNNISENEVRDLLDRYGDNVQAYKAIKSIAVEKGIRVFNDHPIDAEIADVEAMSKVLCREMSNACLANKVFSDGIISALEAQVDRAVPAE